LVITAHSSVRDFFVEYLSSYHSKVFMKSSYGISKKLMKDKLNLHNSPYGLLALYMSFSDWLLEVSKQILSIFLQRASSWVSSLPL